MKYVLPLILCLYAAARGASITDEPFNAVAGDGLDDTAAIQAAISAQAEGATVVIPSGVFNVSMAKGILIDVPRLKIVIEGDLAVTTEGRESDQCMNLFTVRAPGVQFLGRGGMIHGNGIPFIGPKSDVVHRTLFYPVFIYVTSPADDCVVSGLRLRDSPGGFAAFVGVKDCRVTGNTFEGGTPQLSEEQWQQQNPVGPFSRYMGIFMVSTTGLMIQSNHFHYFENRGMFQWICASGSGRHPGTVIAGNVFEGGYDHAIYTSGIIDSVVAHNTIRDSVGSAIKLIGNDLIVTGNHILNCGHGGIETRNGSRNIIAHNVIHGFGHRAISISPYGGGGGTAYTDNIVQGNILIGHNDPDKPPVMAAIWIESRDHVSRCKVLDNIVHHTGTGNAALSAARPGEPAIHVGAPNDSEAIVIRGNTIHDAKGGGISLKNVSRSMILENHFNGEGEPLMVEGGGENVLRDNR